MRILAISFAVFQLAAVSTGLAQTFTANTPKGDIVFSTVGLFNQGYTTYLGGTVTNRTTVDVPWLEVQVFVENNKGQPRACAAGPCTIHVLEIARGAPKALKEIILPVRGGIFRPEELYVTGVRIVRATYHVAYGYSLLKPRANDLLAFDDAGIAMVFSIRDQQIEFTLTNKTDAPIRIDWNNLSYIDPSKSAHKVFHAGVKYSSRAESLPATLVPPGAKIEDLIAPVDYAHYVEGRYGGWSSRSLFLAEADLMAPPPPELKDLQGATLGIFMPLEVNGRTENYNFVFRIDKVLM